MAYITLLQANTILEAEGGPEEWNNLQPIVGPPAVTVDTQKEQFIERATRRIESISFQDESLDRDTVRYTDGFVTDSTIQKIPHKLAIATALLAGYYAGNVLSEYKEVPISIFQQTVPGLDDLPLTVQAALWPFISDELKARDSYTAARALRASQNIKAIPFGVFTGEDGETVVTGSITIQQVYRFLLQILQAGGDVTLTPNSINNKLTISVTGVGLDATEVRAQIAAFARHGNLLRTDVEKQQDISDSFIQGGWSDAAPTNTGTIEPFVGTIKTGAQFTASDIVTVSYRAGIQTGAGLVAHTSNYFPVRIPVSYTTPLSRSRLRIGASFTYQENPQGPNTDELWLPLDEPNVILITSNATYNYYSVGPIYRTGPTIPVWINDETIYEVQKHTLWQINANRVDIPSVSGSRRTLAQLFTDIAAFIQDGDGTVVQKDVGARIIRIDLENPYDPWVYDATVRIPVAKLGSGTANSSKVLYGDGTWKDEPTGGMATGGQTQAQVQALVRAGVLDWAEIGNLSVIPNDKLPASAKRAAPTLGGLGGLNQTEIVALIIARVLNWAETGNSDLVPTNKLGTGTADSTKILYGDQTWKDAASGGLTTNQVDARIANFAKVGALQRTSVDKQQDISDAFDEGGWINAAGAGSTAATAPYVREEARTTIPNATEIQGGTWGQAYTIGARRTNQVVSARVPKSYPYPIDELRVRKGGGVDHDDDPDDPTNEQWFPLEDATVVNTPSILYDYYAVRVGDIATGDTYRVQRNLKFKLDRSRIDGGQELLPPNPVRGTYPFYNNNDELIWKHEAHVGGTLLVDNVLETISLALGTTRDVRDSAITLFNPVFDLDDDDKQNGVFNITLNVRLDNVTDVNMGFVQGKSNQDASDRSRNVSARIFASTLRNTDAFIVRSTGALNGVAVDLPIIYSGPTLVGEPEFLLVRDSSNRAGYYEYYTGTAGVSTPNIRITIIGISFVSNDAPADVVTGTAIGSLAGRTSVLPTAAVARGTDIGANPGVTGQPYPYHWNNLKTGYSDNGANAGSNLAVQQKFRPPFNPISPEVWGLVYRTKVGDDYIQTAFVPYGPGALTDETTGDDYTATTLYFRGGGFTSGAVARIIAKYETNIHGFASITLSGDGTALPANSTLEIYEAISGEGPPGPRGLTGPVGLTRSESNEITIMGSGNHTYSFAHGGTRQPDTIYAKVVCKVADTGYVVGDEVQIITEHTSGTAGWTLYSDSTNINLGVNNLIQIRGAGANLATFVTASTNWRLILGAVWYDA